MKTIKILFFLLYIANAVNAQKKEILILGTNHYSDVKSDSITSVKKQGELIEILNALKQFKPQQIFVERPSSQDSIFFKAFIAYKKGIDLPADLNWLRHNEIYQVGIKLAAALNIDAGVQGIDWRLPALNSDNQVFKNDIEKNYFLYAKGILNLKYEPDSASLKLITSIHYKYSKFYSINKDISLKDVYLTLNKKENIEELYIANRLGEIYLDKNNGAERTDIGTFRDYKTFRNALNIIKPETQRILIIYGAGHIQLLRQLFQYSGVYKIREISEFLK